MDVLREDVKVFVVVKKDAKRAGQMSQPKEVEIFT